MTLDYSKIKYPYCDKSYFKEGLSITTLSYYPPIYKDSVNINPDRNISTTTCHCLNCGKEFYIRGNATNGYEVTK